MKNKQAGTRRRAAVSSSPSLRQSSVRCRSPAPGSAGSDRTTALAGLGGSAHHSAPASLPSFSSLPPRRSGARSLHTHRHTRGAAAPLGAYLTPTHRRAGPRRASAGSDIAAPWPPCHAGRGGRASPRAPHRRTQARQRCPCRPPQQPRRSRRRPQARGDPAVAALGSPCGGAGGRVCERFPRPRPSLRGAGERAGRPPRQAGVGCIALGPAAAPSLWFCSPAGASRGRPRLPPASARPPAGLPGPATFPFVGRTHRPGCPRAPAPTRPRLPRGPALGGVYLHHAAARGPRPLRPGRWQRPVPTSSRGTKQGRSALTSAQRGAPHSRCPARTAHRRGFRLRSAPLPAGPGRAGLRGRARPPGTAPRLAAPRADTGGRGRRRRLCVRARLGPGGDTLAHLARPSRCLGAVFPAL